MQITIDIWNFFKFIAYNFAGVDFMQRQVNKKPIKKVRRVEPTQIPEPKNKPPVCDDIDDFIYGDKKTSPSNR